MSYLNANTPIVKCLMRREFMFDLREHHGEFEPVNVFGVTSIRGAAILFTVMTEHGAQFTHVPIHALVHRENAPRLALDALELWDAFGYRFGVHQFAYLKDLSCVAHLRGHGPEPGEYLFTIDWCGGDEDVDVTYAEIPDEHKSAHVLKLENGCFAALPNNRIIWHEPSFITKPLDLTKGHPGYRTNSHRWSVESHWHAEDSDAFFYGLEDDGDDTPGSSS